MQVTSINPAAVLDVAADILETEGWRRTSWGTYCGPKCADGALKAAAIHLAGGKIGREYARPVAQSTDLGAEPRFLLTYPAYEAYLGAVEEADNLIGVTLGMVSALSHRARLIQWNDRQRDRRKVVRLFRRGAKVLRAMQAAA